MIYGHPVTFGGASGEIDITADGTYDVKKYATANVNVQSAPVLLWTNASPTSGFAEQTLNVPTGYDAYLVEYRESQSDAYYGVAYLPHLSATQVSACGTRYTAPYSWMVGRKITSCRDGSISFGIGFRNYFSDSYSGGSSGNGSGMSIPTRIWGLKYTL